MTTERDSVGRFPTRLVVITLSLTLATFWWVVLIAYAGARLAALQASDARLNAQYHAIRLLHDRLTTAARMAAATGESRWEQDYRRDESALNAAIERTTAGPAIAPSRQTDGANAGLAAAENRAFALVRNGRPQDALALLLSPTYEEQKAIYAGEVDARVASTRERFKTIDARIRDGNAVLIAGAAVCFGLSLWTWMAVLRNLRRTQRELAREVDARTAELRQTNQTLLAEIAERQKTQLELVEARDVALEATRQKAEFLANMSHEIRTPMNGVIGMTELALDTDLTVQQREYLDMAKGSAETLLRIVNDILDFSKIEAGRLTLEPAEFKLRDILDDTLKPMGLRAREKGLELLCDVHDDVPDVLVADAGRICQVLVNLVGNAIKFTRTGEVLVSIGIEQQEAANAHDLTLHVAVSDTGIGIPLDKQSMIFAAFSQADGSITRTYGGTGLGLTISSNLVQMMGGRIWVESTPGSGTTFHFTLRGHVPAAAQAPAQPPPPELAGLSVLIVDDNATNRRILERTVEKWQMHPTLVASGEAALTAVREALDRGTPFRLMLLDVAMPEMDGLTVARRLKEDHSLTPPPAIVMLTSSGEPSHAARCRELGISEYLVKPVRRLALLNAILTALGRLRSSHVVAVPPPAPLPSGPSLRVLLAEDNVVNQRVAIGVLEGAGHVVTLAVNGREALAALEASAFDLVLMDEQMPEMSGSEATAAIRERERVHGGHLPIIALTAHALAGDRDRCLAAGADGYVAKPIARAELFREMEIVTSHGATPPAQRKMTVVLDEGTLLARVGGNQALLQEVIGLFLEDCPRLVDAIRRGLADGDAGAVYRTAHTLKGSAGNFGGEDVIAALRRLEASAREGDLSACGRDFALLEPIINRLTGELTAVAKVA